MLVHDLITQAAERRPEHVYIASEPGRWSYSDFLRMINTSASFFSDLRINRGDRVIIALDNRVESYALLFAAISAGAIAVPLTPTLPPEKLQYVLDNCQPSVFCGGKSLDNLRHTKLGSYLKTVIGLGGVPEDGFPNSVRVVEYRDVISSGGVKAPQFRLIDLDPAAIIYTSGSAGTPKGIILSHLNILTAIRSITSYLGLTEDDRVIDFQPPFFDYGLYQSFLTAFVGATLSLARNFVFPSEVLNKIEQQRITVVPFVPTNITTLFSRGPSIREPLTNVRLVTSTGARFPAQHIPSLRTLFPNATIFSMYGLTECKRVSYLPPELLDAKPSSVGIPMPNVEVWIVGEQDRPVGPHTVGQLVVRGSNVALGYWGDPEGSAARFRVQPNGERWLYTGDYFKQDEDGCLYFIGRKDDLLKVGGYRTSTKEIEATLALFQPVQEVAAIPIPDEVLGHSTKVFVVPKPDHWLTTEIIRRYCHTAFETRTLAPKVIEIVSNLPRTGTGKTDYESLVQAG
ncbi:MAG: acyl--CoA ligase [Acidobacteria bacterium]|nr:acyl--CoA ligase [Acidobacteriota bacterium]